MCDSFLVVRVVAQSTTLSESFYCLKPCSISGSKLERRWRIGIYISFSVVTHLLDMTACCDLVIPLKS